MQLLEEEAASAGVATGECRKLCAPVRESDAGWMSREAAKRENRSGRLAVAVGVLGDEGLDDFGDLLLLSAWKLGRRLEDLVQLAFGGLTPWLWWSDAEQLIGRYVQSGGERVDLISA